MSLQKRVSNNLPGVVVFLTIGLGILGGQFGIDTGVVWVIGFAVLLPLAGMLGGSSSGNWNGDERGNWSQGGRTHDTDEDLEPTDPLDRLRDRYARGDLSDEDFERKLEALLETQTPEGARERARRGNREAAVDAE